jgi:hypothetical protein
MKIKFPLNGLHKGFSIDEQPQHTTFDIQNCRPYDTLSGRLRGGQRPGLDKWGNGDQIGEAEQPVVAICNVQSLR